MAFSFSVCWQCGQPAGSLFCPACGALQRPPAGFFTFFGLPERLSLDAPGLQKRFYDLSRQLHPDRYTRKPEREREFSLEASAILNDGYRTLRDPVKRAEYVLTRHGFDIGEQRSNNAPPELLEEVFELNMTLEDMRGGDAAARPQLEQAGAHFRELLSGVDAELDREARAFDDADEAGRGEILKRVRAALNRRRYIQNLVREVDKELAPAA